MVFKHKNPYRLEEIEKMTAGSGDKHHEGYATFCLFVRKLRMGMHYVRVGGDGSHEKTNVMMRANNQGIKYFAGGAAGRKVGLKFAHLTAVVDLARPMWEDDDDDDPTNDLPPEQLAVQKLLKATFLAAGGGGGGGNDGDAAGMQELVERAVLLVFQDGEDDGDEVSERDLALLPEKYAFATALLRLSKLALLPTPKRALSMFGRLTSGGSTTPSSAASPSGSDNIAGSGSGGSIDRGSFDRLGGALSQGVGAIGAKLRANQIAAEEKAREKRNAGKTVEEIAKEHEKYLQRLTGLVNGGTVEANGLDCVLLLANR
jgi:hypothetical protein